MSSPRQPAYHNNTTYIDSPFDEPDPYEKQHPFNPNYSAPAPPHGAYDHGMDAEKHNNAYQQSYAMHDMGGQNNNSNHGQYYSNRESYQKAQATPQLYNGYDEDRPSLSNDTAPMRPNADLERSRYGDDITPIKYRKEKSKYLPCFPCIRSTCGRICCCFCLLLLLIIIAVAIVIVTMFKLPKVDFVGMSQDPVFQFHQGNTTFSATMGANIRVENPNPIGFNFERITATAFYPGFAPSIGGGEINNVRFPSKATTQITFPLRAAYSTQQDPGFTVVSDIARRCALTGGSTKQNLQINYDLTLTMKIIGISISPTIKNQHISFACPTNMDQILRDLPAGVLGI